MTDSTRDTAGNLGSRLEKLGVTTPLDELEELAAAYPALLAWIRIADELAGEEAAMAGDA